jgi:abortive infection bacteriophage resistance protein
MPPSYTTKPHLELPQLVERLKSRGMIIPDEDRAVRKLSQIGYYRLSGFWYPCRRPKFDGNGKFLKDRQTGLPVRDDTFQENVNFNDIIDLYLFDKNLRQLMIDAIERIEIYIRTVIAHEIGRLDPLAYQKGKFINPRILEDREKHGQIVNHWKNWTEKHDELVRRSKEDSIKWYRDREIPIPFWVVVECWDYGIMSKYFENLNGRCRNKVAQRLEFESITALLNWLTEINILRNRCAHHARIWNHETANPVSVTGLDKNPYFQRLDLSPESRKKIYGRICVIWYLVKKIGPSSTWINKVADLVDSKPNIDCCPFTAMGLPDNNGFPRELFEIQPR